MKKSIVVPVYKRWDLAGSLLLDLHKHEKENIDKIVIVDDCSNDQDVNEGVYVLSKILPITKIANEGNLGFTLSANIGLEYASNLFAEDHAVFLISSDVTISGKFINQFAGALSEKALLGHKMLYGDTGWNTFDGKIFSYLEGYFLACAANGWKELGFLDPGYAPYDYEDVDLSATARAKGYKLIPLASPVIKHLGGGTIGYNPARQSITERNREYFRKKWMG